MNESKLKDLFVGSIESGHIFDSKNRNLPFTNINNKMRIKTEGYFGQIDLVIAILKRENKSVTCQNSENSETYYNVLLFSSIFSYYYSKYLFRDQVKLISR
jgi:hypothetical protein